MRYAVQVPASANGIAAKIALRRDNSQSSLPTGKIAFSSRAASAKASADPAVTKAPQPGTCRASHQASASTARPLAGHSASRLGIRAASGLSRSEASRDATMSSGVDKSSKPRPAPSQPFAKQAAPPKVSPSPNQISQLGRTDVSISRSTANSSTGGKR